MQYEYMTWHIGMSEATSVKDFNRVQGGLLHYQNGIEIPNWLHGSPLPQLLREAGLDGWELVAIYSSFNTEPMYIFKRPLPNHQAPYQTPQAPVSLRQIGLDLPK